MELRSEANPDLRFKTAHCLSVEEDTGLAEARARHCGDLWLSEHSLRASYVLLSSWIPDQIRGHPLRFGCGHLISPHLKTCVLLWASPV